MWVSASTAALLHARDGEADRVYEPRSVEPSAIVLIGWGGVVTLAALRFCAKHKIAVVILDWDRDFMTAMALPARRAARIARAQLKAMTPVCALTMAKALIADKIEAHARLGAITGTKAEAVVDMASCERSRLENRRKTALSGRYGSSLRLSTV